MKKTKVVLVPQYENLPGVGKELNGKYIVQELHGRMTPTIDTVVSSSYVDRLLQDRNTEVVIKRTK